MTYDFHGACERRGRAWKHCQLAGEGLQGSDRAGRTGSGCAMARHSAFGARACLTGRGVLGRMGQERWEQGRAGRTDRRNAGWRPGCLAHAAHLNAAHPCCRGPECQLPDALGRPSGTLPAGRCLLVCMPGSLACRERVKRYPPSVLVLGNPPLEHQPLGPLRLLCLGAQPPPVPSSPQGGIFDIASALDHFLGPDGKVPPRWDSIRASLQCCPPA